MESFSFTEYDKRIMKNAINLAGKARGLTSPNPMVGAVIVKDSKIISSGYHKKAGYPHAEIEAINACSDKEVLKGASLYVTLEPCCIHGKTPPCTDAIIKYGFSEVIAGIVDPNPKISGRGIKKLKNSGIKVRSGLLEEEIKDQNEFYLKHILSKSPFITIKIAASIDGKIAAKTGDSRWITGIGSRNLVHKIRKDYDCILTGINTVIIDDPLLYPRKKGSNRPDIDKDKKFYRVVLDSSLKINIDSNIVRTAKDVKTIVFTSIKTLKGNKKAGRLRELGIDVIGIPVEKTKANASVLEKEGLKKLCIPEVLKYLYENYGITSIIIEAGPTLTTEFLKKKLVDKFLLFISPIIIGGDSHYNMFSKLDILKIKSSIKLNIKSKKSIGDDILLTAYPANKTKGG